METYTTATMMYARGREIKLLHTAQKRKQDGGNEEVPDEVTANSQYGTVNRCISYQLLSKHTPYIHTVHELTISAAL